MILDDIALATGGLVPLDPLTLASRGLITLDEAVEIEQPQPVLKALRGRTRNIRRREIAGEARMTGTGYLYASPVVIDDLEELLLLAA